MTRIRTSIFWVCSLAAISRPVLAQHQNSPAFIAVYRTTCAAELDAYMSATNFTRSRSTVESEFLASDFPLRTDKIETNIRSEQKLLQEYLPKGESERFNIARVQQRLCFLRVALGFVETGEEANSLPQSSASAGRSSTIGTGRQPTSKPLTRPETPPNKASNNRSTRATTIEDRSGTRDGTNEEGLPKLVKNANGELILPPIPGQPASECAAINPKPGLYGGFVNKCAFRINISYCAYKPHKDAWNAIFNCEKGGGGLDDIKANGTRAAHTNGTHMYWFACKYPSTPTGLRFVPGQGLRGRCS